MVKWTEFCFAHVEWKYFAKSIFRLFNRRIFFKLPRPVILVNFLKFLHIVWQVLQPLQYILYRYDTVTKYELNFIPRMWFQQTCSPFYLDTCIPSKRYQFLHTRTVSRSAIPWTSFVLCLTARLVLWMQRTWNIYCRTFSNIIMQAYEIGCYIFSSKNKVMLQKSLHMPCSSFK